MGKYSLLTGFICSSPINGGLDVADGELRPGNHDISLGKAGPKVRVNVTRTGGIYILSKTIHGEANNIFLWPLSTTAADLVGKSSAYFVPENYASNGAVLTIVNPHEYSAQGVFSVQELIYREEDELPDSKGFFGQIFGHTDLQTVSAEQAIEVASFIRSLRESRSERLPNRRERK